MKGHEQIQFALNLRQEKVNVDVKSVLNHRKLSKKDKLEIFHCIRYSYIPHEELVVLSIDKEFELAKELVIQGLSCRLDSYEVSSQKELKINLEPRLRYKVEDENAEEGSPMNISTNLAPKVAG